MLNRRKTTVRNIDPVSAAGCLIITLWGVGVLLSLTASVVVIWAIIKLVIKFTA